MKNIQKKGIAKMRIQSEKNYLQRKVDGHYIWTRVSFYQASTFFNIPNCYAKIWVSDNEPFPPPNEKFLLLEDIVLLIQSDNVKKQVKQKSNSNLVAIKNMEKTFPGANGSLYVNTFQIASIMPLDPNSELISDLNRVTTMKPVDTPELPEQQLKKSVIQFDEKSTTMRDNEPPKQG